MKWNVAAPFFKDGQLNHWIDNFVVTKKHSFHKVVSPASGGGLSWHQKNTPNTLLTEWGRHCIQGNQTLNSDVDGCITIFPQLAAMVGIKKNLFYKNKPVIAWCFNLGNLYKGPRGLLSRAAFSRIDKFVVHSRRECSAISNWLGIEKSRVEFHPLQRAEIPVYAQEDQDSPFLLSMGSANRDYETFFQAVKTLKLRTIVVAGKHALKGIDIPSNVEVMEGLSFKDCHTLAQKARVNIVPLRDVPTGAGQITIIEAMTMGRSTVATKCVGSEDYVEHEKTGLLVNPYSVPEMKTAITDLWFNADLRSNLGNQARIYSRKNFSDEAAGNNLLAVIERLI